MPDGVTPVNDDTALWDNNGNWLQPSGNYVINYKAILNWIVNVGPNPFPSQLRSGNILYYSSIPTDVPAASYNHTVLNSTISEPGPAILEGIHRLRAGRVARPDRQRPDSRQLDVQLRTGLCLRRRHRREHQRARHQHEVQRHRVRGPDR